jgi:hypothetical protein
MKRVYQIRRPLCRPLRQFSYLVYPDFETDPHPALVRAIKLNLRTRQIECYDYAHTLRGHRLRKV